ncbi:MAG: hypothetical protein ACTIA5_10875 [Brachybacterium tyrofermentans]|uniref:hypothetical protein n=1 Tax=Brachybacterium tyrofermentans TaxID=47848 RepID=UPI003FBA2D56
MPRYLIVPLVLCVIGLVMLAYGVWARAGRTPRARRWLTDTSTSRYTGIDLLTLITAPGFGLALCWYGVLMALDMTDPPTGANLIPLAALLVSTVAAAGAWLRVRVPDALYPGWARTIRAEQRRSRP